ncbi:hypothetical protein DMP08_05150 [Paraeggerthella hongkongensis]|uniref:Uncharacterized protein n=1 Tax=Paraeggerthella hongkongensis TaxID=230658 RepID=A0A3N0BDR0_9ACTN|nr:hypothetical protein DMP08_05150 [Paraeggerthella hongkongensis]
MSACPLFDQSEGFLRTVDRYVFELQSRYARYIREQLGRDACERAGFRVGVGEGRVSRIVGHAQGGGRVKVAVFRLGEYGILFRVEAEIAVVQHGDEAGIA